MVRGTGTIWRSLKGQPMGDLLGTITLTEIQSSARFKDTTLTITDCQYVASYNWLNGQKAIILVPGQYAKDMFKARPS